MKKSKLLCLLLVTILLLSMPSCAVSESVNSESPLADNQKVKITLFDSSDNVGLTDKIVHAFNETSTTSYVSVYYINNNLYDNEILERLQSGDDSIDCLYIRQPCQTNQLGTRRLTLDLKEYISHSDLDISNFGSTAEIVTMDNRVYGLPRIKSAWLLFYNKAIFDDAGLPYPTQMTWDEYADLSLQLTKVNASGKKSVWGGFIPFWTVNLGAATAGEYLTDDELPITQKYIRFLNRVYNIDHSNPDSLTMADPTSFYSDDIITFFEDNKVAMMINGDWATMQIHNDEKARDFSLDWDIAPLPVFEDVPAGSTAGGCSYLGISYYSNHPSEAFKFASFYCGEGGADIIAQYAACPAYFTDNSAKIYLQNANVPGAKYFFQSSISNEEGAHIYYRELNQLFKDEIRFYLNGEVDFDTAFDSYFQKRSDILNQE
ncbi:ABC transporter substrate-binding protein [Scatolibacter rhodanostii]|uniref:ABC transporter substrate-binding protein n=1 Tax=Scatolibacter rhodanostii TaxID=2014781 RepID=UPI000C07F719|nr:extracellular solute-binding protein [Scatolibacter rhodanostii]